MKTDAGSETASLYEVSSDHRPRPSAVREGGMFSFPAPYLHALRCLSRLAELPEGALIRKADLVEAEDLPPNITGKLCHRLRRAGIISSSRGPDGGYRLARAPEKIDLLEVLRAVTELGSPHSRCRFLPGQADQRRRCALHGVISSLEKAMMRTLRGMSLAHWMRTRPDRRPSVSR